MDDLIHPEDIDELVKKSAESAKAKFAGVIAIPLSILKTWPRENLVALRDDIEQIVPRHSLKDLNLEKEMVEQLSVAKRLQDNTLNNPNITPNQKAQVLNATASAISALVKMQVDLKRDEQLKRMEAALMKAVATMDDAARSVFFDTYEQLAITEGVEIDG